jgi:alginate O-acetyltransferase complex protein AlgI
VYDPSPAGGRRCRQADEGGSTNIPFLIDILIPLIDFPLHFRYLFPPHRITKQGRSSMLFHSPFFLFFFLPLLLITFYSFQTSWKKYTLLAWSFIFYFWCEPRFFPVVIASACADFYLAKFIAKDSGTFSGKRALTVGILLNIALLFYFKYLTFFLSSTNSLFSYFNIPPMPLWEIALPIGVSFIVFEKITYLVDIYRQKGQPADSLRNYLLYVFLFPKLLAGPIVKYHDIATQLQAEHHTFDNFIIGFKRFLLGLVKKILIADTVAELADQIFLLPANELGFSLAWLGIICFTFQIYFDFSAYSDMAIGLARMFGFKLFENFNMPYIASSFTDFWRRWHISLSTWIKEYLYIPLGGNKKNVTRTYFNLWCCFLLSGLWHGASWNYILWGAYNGLFLVMDRVFWLRFMNRLPSVVPVLVTFFFVLLGWVIFRATSFSHIVTYFAALFSPNKESIFIQVTANQWTAIMIATVLCFTPLFYKFETLSNSWGALRYSRVIENWGLLVLALFAIAKTIAITFNPFLYFRF